MKANASKLVRKTIAIPAELYRQCEASAKKDKRTFSAWVRIQLEGTTKSTKVKS